MASPGVTYHARQYQTPYRSTVALHAWLKSLDCFRERERIVDICCGMGGPMAYFAAQEPHCSFFGIDRDADLVAKADLPENARIEQGDLYELENYRGKFDGILNLQTLSWLPDVEKPLCALCELTPKWIALTSLFYDGPLNTIIQVTESDSGKTHNYNVYSIPLVRNILASYGFTEFISTQFEIDVDLPPTTNLMGTYTEKLADGRRLQFSGPLLMPWHFVYARK
jgi:trans-aconitate methyltransferase